MLAPYLINMTQSEHGRQSDTVQEVRQLRELVIPRNHFASNQYNTCF